MAELFDLNFNNGNVDWVPAWPFVPNGFSFPFIGQSYTRCLGCGGDTLQEIGLQADNMFPLAEGTHRWQMASIPGSPVPGTPTTTPGGPYGAAAGIGGPLLAALGASVGVGFPGFAISTGMSYNPLVPTEGQLTYRINRGGQVGGPSAVICGPLPRENPWYFASNLIPNLHDGNWKGVQYKWFYDDGAQTLRLVTKVDNVEVNDFTLSTMGSNGLANPSCLIDHPLNNSVERRLVHYQWGPLSPGHPTTYGGLHYVLENMHLDDVAQDFDWVGITDAQPLTALSCGFQPPIYATVEGDCTANTLTITGTALMIEGATRSIMVQGPLAVVEAFDVLSESPTELVLGNFDPPIVTGRYCVTVSFS